MNYSRRDVIIGFAIILILVLGAFLYRRSKTPKSLSTPIPTAIEFQEDLEKNFKYDIPNNVDSIELKDVSGGDSRGIATDKEVLIDANDPTSGYFYQGWLVSGEKVLSIGKLQIAKGGWLLEYDKSKLPNAEKIVISLEKNFDNRLENKVLEGSFK